MDLSLILELLGAAVVPIVIWEFAKRLLMERAQERRLQNRALTLNNENKDLQLAKAPVFLRTGRFRGLSSKSTTGEPVGTITVSLGEHRQLPNEVSRIIASHKDSWGKKDLWEANDMAGVTAVGFPGSLEGRNEIPGLRLEVSPQSYYEALATMALRSDMTAKEIEWVHSQSVGKEPGTPVSTLVCPLGIHVILLFHDKDKNRKVVLQRRSKQAAFRGGLLFPSVGEAVSTVRDAPDYDKKVVDVENALFRGLKEELGLEPADIDDHYFTSLVFDKDAWKFDLTAVALTSLNETSIKGRHAVVAVDKWEAPNLEFYDFPADVPRSGDGWTPEALGAYEAAVVDQLGPKIFSSHVR
jgi:hypothetical protein